MVFIVISISFFIIFSKFDDEDTVLGFVIS